MNDQRGTPEYRRIQALESERDRLKASLDHQEKTCETEFITIPSASWNRMIKDRDQWKAKAEKLAEALRELLSGHDNLYRAHWPGLDPKGDIATHAARISLAAFDKDAEGE